MRKTKLAIVPLSILALGLSTGCIRQSKDQRNEEARVPVETTDTMANADRPTSGVEPVTGMDPSVPAIGNTPDTAPVVDANVSQPVVDANVSQKDFGQLMTDRLNAFDDRIDTIEDGLEDRGAAAENAYAAKLSALKSQRQAAATQLNELKGADESVWAEMRGGVTTAFTNLETSVVEAEQWIQAH